MKTIRLPDPITDSIENILKESNSNEWLKSAVALSLKYRVERVKQGISYIRDYSDVLGYLSLRVSSTYAQIYGSLASIKQINPSWKPVSLLDIGSGPGTAIWATEQLFPSITQISAVEKDPNFITVGKKILSNSSLKPKWYPTNFSFSVPHTTEKFDLVILANVLNEMDDNTRQKTIEFAYKHCQGILVVVEPGTPFGNESNNQTVTELSKYNPKLTAPFIENKYYPSEDIVFSQRIIRPDFQKRVRQLQRKMDLTDKTKLLPPSDWEDAKYSYIVFSKFPSEIQPQARLIKNPQLYKPFVELSLLTKDGIIQEKIFKKEKEKFKLAKK